MWILIGPIYIMEAHVIYISHVYSHVYLQNVDVPILVLELRRHLFELCSGMMVRVRVRVRYMSLFNGLYHD